MKITEKIISIPPYISASWSEVKRLQLDENELCFFLKDESVICIPSLKEEEIKDIFEMHAKVLENEDSQEETSSVVSKNIENQLFQMEQLFSQDKMTLPIKVEWGDKNMGLEEISMMMQHNPEQKNMPVLPQEIIGKVSMIGQILGYEEGKALQEPELNCNCFYCQIVRAMHKGIDNDEHYLEEEISEEDLRFREWNIQKIDEKLYQVTNPFNDKESYQVYLGDPIGCTCGKKNCKHMEAVLKT